MRPGQPRQSGLKVINSHIAERYDEITGGSVGAPDTACGCITGCHLREGRNMNRLFLTAVFAATAMMLVKSRLIRLTR